MWPMEIGIVGLPKGGNTTIFNALTRGTAQVATYGGSLGKPNIGVAKVPDRRLEVLEGIFKPKRKVPSEVIYVDIPAAPEGFGETQGISGEFLNYLQRTDALLVVARAFEDPSVHHAADSIDPIRDVETMHSELASADLEILNRRLARLDEQSKGAKAPERETLNKEQALLNGLKADLERGTPVRDHRVSPDEARLLEGFQLLTAKPLIVVVNIDESQLSDPSWSVDGLSSISFGSQVRAAALCGKLEMELGQMEPAEEQEFRESLELGESGLNRMIRLSHDVLGLVSFFTCNPNEVRAWTVTEGTPAVKAAGKIHSDFERGFIRAELVGFDDLARCGSAAEARKQGLLRQEGKSYVVSEGDVINILFNV